MWIYIITFIFSILFVYVAERTGGLIKYVSLLLAILIPSIIAGLRKETIGTDVRNYVKPIQIYATSSNNYLNYLNSDFYFPNWDRFSRFDKGYTTFAYLCSRINGSLAFNLFITEFLIIALVLVGLFKFKAIRNIPVWIGMSIFYFLCYNLSFNMVRQSIAMFILIFSFTFLLERKWIIYLLLLILAVLFHKTAIFGVIPFLVYIFLYGRANKNIKEIDIKINYSNIYVSRFTCTSIFLIFVAAVIILFPTLLTAVLSFAGLSNFEDGYLSNSYGLALNQIVIRLPFLCILIAQWNRIKNNSLRYFYLVMTAIDILLSQLSGGSDFSSRIAWYSTVFYIYAIPDEIGHEKGVRRYVLFIIVIVYCIAYWLYMYVIKNYNETVPYLFNWQ